MLARSGRAPACTGALRARSGLNGRAPGALRPARARSGRAPACMGALRARSGLHGRAPGALRPARHAGVGVRHHSCRQLPVETCGSAQGGESRLSSSSPLPSRVPVASTHIVVRFFPDILWRFSGHLAGAQPGPQTFPWTFWGHLARFLPTLGAVASGHRFFQSHSFVHLRQ